MTSAKVREFLRARDLATARSDWGIVHATTADLRRWGVPDDATLAYPAGKPKKPSQERRTRESVPLEAVRNPGRPKLPKCEHGNVAERCPECNPESLVN